MFADKTLINHEKKLDTKASLSLPRDNIEVAKCVREKLMGVAYLKRVNAEGQQVLTLIRDHHTFGIDVYPNTLHEAYKLLANHSSTNKDKNEVKTMAEEVAFMEVEVDDMVEVEAAEGGGVNTSEPTSMHRLKISYQGRMVGKSQRLNVTGVRKWAILQTSVQKGYRK